MRTMLSLIAPMLLGLAPASPPGESAGVFGTWYLNAEGARLTLTLKPTAAGGRLQGTVVDEGMPRATEPVDDVSWDPAARTLEFRRKARSGWQWFRGTVVEGVFVGRFTPGAASSARPASVGADSRHVTGWNADALEAERGAWVYELLINSGYRARLRLDAPPPGGDSCSGRLKVYATIKRGADGEEEEEDVEVTHWDGTSLRFVRRGDGWLQAFEGVSSGRTMAGTFTHTGHAGALRWEATRAEVLGYGFRPRPPADRDAWQERTRRRLMHLMMAGNPAPISRRITELPGPDGSTADRAPLPSAKRPPHRDDDPGRWPQSYRLRELAFDSTLADLHGGAPLHRASHGYLATPTTPPPPGGKYPAVLAVNGHGGSAWQQMDPDSDPFWYGDAFARRGFVVLALDISHRPIADRRGLYGGVPDGDDPAHGNRAHPAIKSPGFDSDWEEDGERVWDAMRGMDYLLSLPNVDPARVVVTGLSMGGEVASFTAALDPRFALSIPSGYSPDMGVMTHYGNHECWRWLNADIREYVDISDAFALTAPRPLIVQTGKADRVFSPRPEPFAADKQMARRVRAAYGGEAHQFLHYLHYDRHHYHVGDHGPASVREFGLRVPSVIEPTAPWSAAWQTDGATAGSGRTLFEHAASFLNPRGEDGGWPARAPNPALAAP